MNSSLVLWFVAFDWILHISLLLIISKSCQRNSNLKSHVLISVQAPRIWIFWISAEDIWRQRSGEVAWMKKMKEIGPRKLSATDLNEYWFYMYAHIHLECKNAAMSEFQISLTQSMCNHRKIIPQLVVPLKLNQCWHCCQNLHPGSYYANLDHLVLQVFCKPDQIEHHAMVCGLFWIEYESALCTCAVVLIISLQSFLSSELHFEVKDAIHVSIMRKQNIVQEPNGFRLHTSLLCILHMYNTRLWEHRLQRLMYSSKCMK